MADQANTQPIDVSVLLGESEEDVAAAKRRLPDAATLKAALAGVVVFVAAALGKPELGHTEWVDAVVSGYTVAAPLVLGWFIARHRKAAVAATPVALVVTSGGGKHEKT